MTTPYNPIVVNTGGKLVVDRHRHRRSELQRSKGQIGQFQTNLKAAGIDRNAVDMVLISHFHGDHINGLLTPDNKPAFPNAEILVPAVEWKYFMDDGEMSRAPNERMKTVFKGVRRVFDAHRPQGHAIRGRQGNLPGITSVATPGHTPGHISYIIASGSEQGVRAGRRHPCAVRVRAQSGLARVLRPGWPRWPRPRAARSTTCWPRRR